MSLRPPTRRPAEETSPSVPGEVADVGGNNPEPPAATAASGGLAGLAVGVLAVVAATWVDGRLIAPVAAAAVIGVATALGALLAMTAGRGLHLHHR
jgi:predicted phage tail protein